MRGPADNVVGHPGRSPGAAPQPVLPAGLTRPDAYPHPVSRVTLLETHISWVLLTGEFAYKVKKPVELGFLDFRDLERRRFYCEEEVRLNRFWAPSVYLDVLPITVRRGRACVGGDGVPVEYAVRMRQFEQSRRLDNQLDAGRMNATDMLQLAGEIAGRHAAAKRVRRVGPLLRTTQRLMWSNFDDLLGEAPRADCSLLRRWTRSALAGLAATIRSRCEEGYFRECHGDLHLGNIVRLEEGIRAFDCIEFSEELRDIDVVADYGFLVMDLMARDRPDLAFVFLNRYLELSGDYAGVVLLRLYVVYRCLVRAKVAAIRRRERRAGESRDEDTAALQHYCGLAIQWTRRRKPLLVAMSGLSGSGKTWLSTQLVTAMPALRIRSDLERKRLFELGETADSHSAVGAGIYSNDATESVYRRLFSLAAPVLEAGFDVILDAAFLDADNRSRAQRLAAEHGAGFAIVRTTAAAGVLRDRIRRRAAAGDDASEARLEVLEYQLGVDQPLGSDERRLAVVVQTDAGEVNAADVVSKARKVARLPEEHAAD